MRAIKTQYLLAFAVMGSLLPYLPVFLEQRGLDDGRIGLVLAMSGLAVLVSPALAALLADTRMSNRTLLGAVYGLGGLSLAALLGASSFVTILIAFTCFSIAFAPVHALHDGLTFNEFERRRLVGLDHPPYHRVRVFGTIGYILPSLLLYVAMDRGASVGVAMIVAVGFCALGLLNAGALPATAPTVHSQPAAGELPTRAALRELLKPRMLAFCMGMFLLYLAASAYYGFYPRYLTDASTVAIDARWVGLISSLGVSVEVGFMLGYALLVRRLTLRGLVMVCVLGMAARMAMLAIWPHPGVAVGSQGFHGFQVLMLHVIPPLLLNRAAGPGFRSSMQGLYAMGVQGVGRMVGSVVSGYVAAVSLTGLFLLASALCLAALPLLAWSVPRGAEADAEDRPPE